MAQGQIDIKEDIAARLRKAREAAGFSSAEAFCQKFNLPLAEYLTYENAKKAIRASKGMLYCDLLHISLQELMLGKIWEKIKKQ